MDPRHLARIWKDDLPRWYQEGGIFREQRLQGSSLNQPRIARNGAQEECATCSAEPSAGAWRQHGRQPCQTKEEHRSGWEASIAVKPRQATPAIKFHAGASAALPAQQPAPNGDAIAGSTSHGLVRLLRSDDSDVHHRRCRGREYDRTGKAPKKSPPSPTTISSSERHHQP